MASKTGSMLAAQRSPNSCSAERLAASSGGGGGPRATPRPDAVVAVAWKERPRARPLAGTANLLVPAACVHASRGRTTARHRVTGRARSVWLRADRIATRLPCSFHVASI